MTHHPRGYADVLLHLAKGERVLGAIVAGLPGLVSGDEFEPTEEYSLHRCGWVAASACLCGGLSAAEVAEVDRIPLDRTPLSPHDRFVLWRAGAAADLAIDLGAADDLLRELAGFDESLLPTSYPEHAS